LLCRVMDPGTAVQHDDCGKKGLRHRASPGRLVCGRPD
jgi:hypothetical protein